MYIFQPQQLLPHHPRLFCWLVLQDNEYVQNIKGIDIVVELALADLLIEER